MAYSKQNFQDGQILTAANLEKMENGIIAGQGAKNLLVNSDFRIAHAGRNSTYDSLKYVCDKWISWDADATFGDGYMTPGSPIDQRVSKDVIDINKTYTAAICLSDGTIRVESGTFANGFGSYALGIYCMKQGDSYPHVTVRLNTGNNIRWVALYEGSYTADTLPNYIPKDKHVEMLNCNVPLAPHNLLDNSDFRNPVNQRGATTYTGSLYTIDRWRTWSSSSTVTITSDGIKGDGTSASVLYQNIEDNKIPWDKAYTMAVGYSDGSVLCKSGVFTSEQGVGIWNSEAQAYLTNTDSKTTRLIRLWHATKTIAWAALYEGAYDASTLPAYQPKGYAAELAECQRYYVHCGEGSWMTGFFKVGEGLVVEIPTANNIRTPNPTIIVNSPKMFTTNGWYDITYNSCAVTKC